MFVIKGGLPGGTTSNGDDGESHQYENYAQKRLHLLNRWQKALLKL